MQFHFRAPFAGTVGAASRAHRPRSTRGAYVPGCPKYGTSPGASLEDVNRDMIAIVAFVGLIMFSVLESLSGLGQIAARHTDLASSDVQEYAPLVYGLMMLLTAVMGLVTYIRLRIAVGNFSLQIDPSDRPFRPLRLTDSFLGYVLAFLFGVSIYIIASLYWPTASGSALVIVALVASSCPWQLNKYP